MPQTPANKNLGIYFDLEFIKALKAYLRPIYEADARRKRVNNPPKDGN